MFSQCTYFFNNAQCSFCHDGSVSITVFTMIFQMITVNALLFPSSITNSLIAVGNDGPQEQDRMVRACIAIICELGRFADWSVNCNVSVHECVYVDLMNVHVCVCSTGEPWDCGQERWSQHHPEECNRLPAQSHQWGSDDHRPAPAQSPTNTAIRSLWRGARGLDLSSTINPSEIVFANIASL